MENQIYTILIVDDNANNLKVLGGVLSEKGYEFRMAKSGMAALGILEKITPDLILLDIQMPEMDGFETCIKIKENTINAKIPIIFLTANTDAESIKKAFKVGGVDFITKPFNSDELLARIKTHIKLKCQTEELFRQNATKDKFFSIISHDLINPISSISGLSELFLEDIDDLDQEKMRIYLKHIHEAANFSLEILKNLLEWARMQQGSLTSVKNNVNLNTLLDDTMKGHYSQAIAKGINFEMSLDDNLKVFADEKMISTVVRNLISNAIKFTDKGGVISISSGIKVIDDKTVIETSIKDSGIGISEEDISKLFRIENNYSSQGTNNEKGTGLGLILCKEFLNQNNGTIRVESEPNVGSDFVFTLDMAN